MSVTSDGKWFWIDPPDAPVAQAAEQILAVRLAEVEKYLPLAAGHSSEDVEFVHQLRVSCRRAAAALRAFRPLTKDGDKPLRRWLRRLRRAAGPARDADVLVARLRSQLDMTDESAQQLVAHVEKQRRKAQRLLAKVNAKADQGGLARAIAKCRRRLVRAKSRRVRQPFVRFAHAALAPLVDCVARFDAPGADYADLHQLRIAAKQLRYAIEIFHDGVGPALRSEAYPLVEELQERLGAVNDAVAAQEKNQRWLSKLPPNGFAAFLAGLIVKERAQAERLREEFLAWWTSDRQAQLKRSLSAALDKAAPRGDTVA